MNESNNQSRKADGRQNRLEFFPLLAHNFSIPPPDSKPCSKATKEGPIIHFSVTVFSLPYLSASSLKQDLKSCQIPHS